MENLLNENVQHIEQFAEMMLSQTEIATSLGFEVAEFLTNDKYKRAFEIGNQKAITTHKKKVQLLANQGSGPAQTMLEKLSLNVRLNSIRNDWE